MLRCCSARADRVKTITCLKSFSGVSLEQMDEAGRHASFRNALTTGGRASRLRPRSRRQRDVADITWHIIPNLGLACPGSILREVGLVCLGAADGMEYFGNGVGFDSSCSRCMFFFFFLGGGGGLSTIHGLCRQMAFLGLHLSTARQTT